MRKEYYNYVVKLPVLLHELFRGKVADYHFSDMTVVMNHLVKSYIRMTDGGRVSTATRRILLCMDRIPDMSFFFRRQEKSVLFFEMDPAVAGSLQRAIIAGGWGPIFVGFISECTHCFTASVLSSAWCAPSAAVPV